jgi:hypothetical protein
MVLCPLDEEIQEGLINENIDHLSGDHLPSKTFDHPPKGRARRRQLSGVAEPDMMVEYRVAPGEIIEFYNPDQALATTKAVVAECIEFHKEDRILATIRDPTFGGQYVNVTQADRLFVMHLKHPINHILVSE